MASRQTMKVLDHSYVAPPPTSVSTTTTIPLTFFDKAWLYHCPVQKLYFYEIPQPTLHFTETIIPHLKHSLSQTLQHFFPFAANLICPPPPNEPYIYYTEGDSVAVTVAESDADFNHLVAYNARDAQQFQSLFSKLPFASASSDKTDVVPVMAIQVTIFPNSGISIGATFMHVAADGRSFDHFIKFWASVYKSGGGDFTYLPIPYHNKDVIKEPEGVSSIFLKDWWSWDNFVSDAAVPEDLVRVTLVISKAQIQKLKYLVMSTQSRNDDVKEQLHVSTFTVTCGFMWVNLIKLQESTGKITSTDQLHDDLLYYFVSFADCRDRLKLPATYFGNCLSFPIIKAKRKELMGKNGIVFAASAIGRAIRGLDEGPLIGAEKWMLNLKEIAKIGRSVSVAGSPRFRVYDTDFGWGRPKKSELGQIGTYGYGCFSLYQARDEEGGVEIGLVLRRDKLNIFNVIFQQNL